MDNNVFIIYGTQRGELYLRGTDLVFTKDPADYMVSYKGADYKQGYKQVSVQEFMGPDFPEQLTSLLMWQVLR